MPCALGAPGSPTNPTWELFFAPGPKSSFGGGFFFFGPGGLCGAAIPEGSALPSFHNHPTPSLRALFPAQTCLSFLPCICVIWADRGVFGGNIHPLLMCRGRSWHGHSCDQNYSPEVQPWNFYCGSQSEKRERKGGGSKKKKKPKHFVLTNGLFEQDYFLTPR